MYFILLLYAIIYLCFWFPFRNSSICVLYLMWYFIYWNILNKIVNSENLQTSSTPERISKNKDLYLENIIWKYFLKLEISCRYEITCRRRQSIVFFIRNNLMVLYIFSGLSTYCIHTDIFYISGKAFVQPKIRPPTWSDQVTKPLMSKFVRYYNCYTFLITAGRDAFLI